MYKKSLILVFIILFVLCIFSGFVSANDDIKNGVSNAANTVVQGVNRLGSDVRDGLGNAENGIKDALKINNNDNNAQNTTNNNNSMARTNNNYTTARTANNLTTNNTSTLWIWLVVAVVAIVMIGLIWYYGSQNNTHHDE